MSKEILKDFHRRRVQILTKSGADLIAFETIPNKLEAEVSKDFLLPKPKIKICIIFIVVFSSSSDRFKSVYCMLLMRN